MGKSSHVCVGQQVQQSVVGELGQIKTKWNSFSLDATTFEHQGNRYYVWTQVEPDVQGSNIMIAKMDTPSFLQDRQVIISRPELDWEQRGFI